MVKIPETRSGMVRFPFRVLAPLIAMDVLAIHQLFGGPPTFFSIRKAQISGEFPLPGASSGALGVEGCDQGEGGTLAIWCTRSEVSQGHAMRPFIDGVSPCRAVGDILTVVI